MGFHCGQPALVHILICISAHVWQIPTTPAYVAMRRHSTIQLLPYCWWTLKYNRYNTTDENLEAFRYQTADERFNTVTTVTLPTLEDIRYHTSDNRLRTSACHYWWNLEDSCHKSNSTSLRLKICAAKLLMTGRIQLIQNHWFDTDEERWIVITQQRLEMHKDKLPETTLTNSWR